MLKYRKWATIVLLFAFIFQLFSHFPTTQAHDVRLIRLYNVQPETLEEISQKGIPLVEAYPTFTLLEVEPHHLEWIKEKSWYFVEEKDYLNLRFLGHNFYSLNDKTLQSPAYLDELPGINKPSDFYLLQWIGPEKKEWKATLEAFDINLLLPLNQYGWIGKMEPQQVSLLRDLRFVRSCGELPYAAKIHKALFPLMELVEEFGIKLTVLDSFNMDDFLASTGMPKELVVLQPVEPFNRVLISSISLSLLDEITLNPHIISIDPYQEYEIFNDRAARIVGTQQSSQGINIPTMPGLDGSGEIAGVADTGIRDTHPDFWDPTFSDKVIATFPTNWDDYHSHGTHVAGTVLGTGAESPNRNLKGIAYNARLVSQNFLGNQGYYSGIGGHYAMLQEAYNAGARTHNNSWGRNWSISYHTTGGGEYPASARDIDRFLWDHMDFTMVKSAGNNRAPNHQEFYYNFFGDYPFPIGTRNITSDSNAKNIICVGATENENGVPVGHPSTWGRSSSIQRNIAWFSSAGPTHDGRIKPDLVAPGDPLMSPNRNHLTSDPYITMSGTSMSGPVVAGSAVLVRQYYKDYHQLTCQDVTSALVKATLINGAQQGIDDSDADRAGYFPYDNQPFPLDPNPFTGFGRINVRNSLFPDQRNKLFVNAYDSTYHSLGISDQEPFDVYYIRTKESPLSLSATLVWTDYADALIPPNASSMDFHQRDLINDLHLEITDLNTMDNYRGNQMKNGFSVLNPQGFDHINNVEKIEIPGTNEGIYRIAVFTMDPITSDAAHGYRQPYALVLAGEDIEWVDESEIPTSFKPAQPMNFTAQLRCEGVQLNWTEPMYTVRPASYYVVTRRIWTGPYAGYVQTYRFEVGIHQWLDHTIQWGHEYYYTIAAYDVDDQLISHSPGVMAGWAVPPERPRLHTAQVEDTVQLYWTRPRAGTCDIQGYHLYRSSSMPSVSAFGSTSSLGSLIAELPVTTTNFVDNDVQQGDEWYYSLVAIDTRDTKSLASSPVKVSIPVIHEHLNLWLESGRTEICQGEMLSVRVYISNPLEQVFNNVRLIANPSRHITFQRSAYLRSRILPDGSIEFTLPQLPGKRTSSFEIQFQAVENIVQDTRASIYFTLRSENTVYDHDHINLIVKKCGQGQPAPYLSVQLRNLKLDPVTGRRYIVACQTLEADISWRHMHGPYSLKVEWGDGNQEEFALLSEPRTTVGHSYAQPNTYSCTITIVDSTGKTLQSTISIEVRRE